MEQDNKDILVKVEGLSKKFCKDLKTSLWYGVKDLTAEMLGHPYSAVLRPKEFWAVKEVGFELRRGECLGLIGHNGAGKSTLLKILNGLINPDDGKVTIKGRVGALIELGAGFNPILSGRENIYNNGAILGFSRKEIDAKLDEIIAFAELEDFIDMPVQHYSSGMKVRLGFAVAAQMEPDVLIIDEVLAVGDLGFVLKCFKIIDQLLSNTAIVFVSHNMPMVSRICNQIILMDHGRIEFKGENVNKGIDLYYNSFVPNNKNVIFDSGDIELLESNIIIQEKKHEHGELNWGDDLELQISLQMKRINYIPNISISIFDKEQRGVAVMEPVFKVYDSKINKQFTVKVKHKKIQLSKGRYSINIAIFEKNSRGPLLRVQDINSFQIVNTKEIWPPFLLDSDIELNDD